MTPHSSAEVEHFVPSAFPSVFSSSPLLFAWHPGPGTLELGGLVECVYRRVAGSWGILMSKEKGSNMSFLSMNAGEMRCNSVTKSYVVSVSARLPRMCVEHLFGINCCCTPNGIIWHLYTCTACSHWHLLGIFCKFEESGQLFWPVQLILPPKKGKNIYHLILLIDIFFFSHSHSHSLSLSPSQLNIVFHQCRYGTD